MRRFFVCLISATLILSGLCSFRTAFAQEGGDGGGGGNEPPPILTIITRVTNNDRGAKGAADFTASVSNDARKIPVTGAGALGANVILNIGNYAVTPAVSDEYAMSMSGACTGSLADGQTATCLIAYDDYGPNTPPPPSDPPPSSDPDPITVPPTGVAAPPAVQAPPPIRNVSPPAPTHLSASASSPLLSSGASNTEISGASGNATSPAPIAPVSGRCDWFWGWFGCYGWVLLLLAAALFAWRAWKAWRRRHQDRPASPPPPAHLHS